MRVNFILRVSAAVAIERQVRCIPVAPIETTLSIQFFQRFACRERTINLQALFSQRAKVGIWAGTYHSKSGRLVESWVDFVETFLGLVEITVPYVRFGRLAMHSLSCTAANPLIDKKYWINWYQSQLLQQHVYVTLTASIDIILYKVVKWLINVLGHVF